MNSDSHDTETEGGAPKGLLSPEGYSRRSFLQRMAALGVLAVGASQLAGCGGDSGGDAGSDGEAAALDCSDPASLSEADVAQRDALQYVEASTTSGQNCTNCQQYVLPATEGSCGTCQVVPGPINPDGWCSVWVEKTA